MKFFFSQENGVKLLLLRGSTPEKYAQSLMDAIFKDEQMANCCFSNIKSAKPCLQKEK